MLKSSGITNFKGLEGKKIGITPGNSHRFYFPEVAKKAGTDPNKLIWTNMDGAAMAAQLIAKNIDAAPFYSIHYYYINKAAVKAGQEILPLPFVEVGFKIYAASLITTDKMIQDKPDLVKRFLAASEGGLRVGRGQSRGGLQAARRALPRGRARRLHGQREGGDEVRLQRPQQGVRLGQGEPERLKYSWRPSPRPTS